MATPRRWTTYDDQFLIDQHDTLPLKVVAAQLDRTTEAIDSRLRYLREKGLLVRRSTQHNWTAADDDYLIAHHDVLRHDVIAETLGRTLAAVRKRISRLGRMGKLVWETVESKPSAPPTHHEIERGIIIDEIRYLLSMGYRQRDAETAEKGITTMVSTYSPRWFAERANLKLSDWINLAIEHGQ